MRWIVFLLIAGATGLLGCRQEAPPSDTQPAATPVAKTDEPTTRPVLPPGHPPLTGEMPTTLPSGPGFLARELNAGPGTTVKLTPPEDWTSLPKRPMTINVYGLPRAEGDSEDAQVAVSMLGMLPPWEMNVERWCAQFELPEGKSCADVAQQRTLDGTEYPTRLVDITGTYKISSQMTGQTGPTKPDYRMITAEIQVGTTPWYVKLIGPAATVTQHEEAFLRFVREAR